MVDVVEAPAPSADDYAQHSFVYLTAIGNALMVGTLVLFLVRIRNEPVKSRGAGMTILSALMCQLHYTLTAVFLFDSYLYRKYGVTNASCHTIYITGLVYVPAATVPIFLRSYSAVFNYTYHMASLSGGPKPWHVRYRWSNKPRYQYMGYFAYNFAWLAIAILAYYLSPARPEPFTVASTCNNFVLPVYVIQIAITTILIIVLLKGMWNTADFFYIKLEMRILLAGCVPAAAIWVVLSALPHLHNIETAYFPLGVALFINLVSLGLPAVMSFRKVYTSQQHQRLRHRGSEDSFREVVSEVVELIVETPALRQSFEQHLVQTWCTETLLFYSAVRQYSSKYLTSTEDERAREFEAIINNFVAIDSPNEINIDDGTRGQLLAAKAHGKHDPELFSRSMREIINLLEQSCVLQWNMTPAFQTALEKAGIARADFELCMRVRPSASSSSTVLDRASTEHIYKPDAAAPAV